MDLESKTLSKTYITQEHFFCTSGQIDPEILKQKLQIILETLQEEIDSFSIRFQQEKDRLLQTIRQKDDIIERLAKANSELTIKNQQLQKSKLRDSVQYKAKLYNFETQYQKEKTHLFSVIKYLQTKNEELSQKLKKLELNTPKRTLKPYAPRSAKYLMVEDFSDQFEQSASFLSKNILKQSKIGPSPTHKHTDSKTSYLSKAVSAKHLSSIFKTDYSECRREDIEQISPIKKNQDELYLPYDKRNNGMSRSTVRMFTDTDSSKQLKKLASYI